MLPAAATSKKTVMEVHLIKFITGSGWCKNGNLASLKCTSEYQNNEDFGHVK
jgi:hypothetical protein